MAESSSHGYRTSGATFLNPSSTSSTPAKQLKKKQCTESRNAANGDRESSARKSLFSEEVGQLTYACHVYCRIIGLIWF